MLLDKRKVGLVTKIGAVVVALAFIVSYIPMILDMGGAANSQQQQQQQQQQAQASEIALLEQTIKDNPKDVNALIRLGNIYQDQRVLDKAIEYYTKALEIQPKNVDVRIDRAVGYFYQGQVETATAEAEKGIEDNPNHSLAYYNLAIFLSAQKRNDEAIKAFNNYLRIEPNGDRAQDAKSQIKTLEAAKSSTAPGSGSFGNK